MHTAASKGETQKAKSTTTFFSKKSAEPLFFAQQYIQPKLSVNQPNDVYEREADSTADRIMRMRSDATEAVHTTHETHTTSVQRACSHCEEEKEKVQRKCAACEEEEKVHRKEHSWGKVPATQSLQRYVGNLSSGGAPLSRSTRSFFETRFGKDFSSVRIHNNTSAAQSAQSINALAYTYGNNIVFGANAFSPETESGKHLIAHELVHVLQQNPQGAKGTIQRKVISPDEQPATSVCQKIKSKEEQPVPASGMTSEGGVSVADSPATEDTANNVSQAAAPGPEKQSLPQPEPAVSKQSETPPEPPVPSGNIAKDDASFQEVVKEANKTSVKQQKHDKPDVKSTQSLEAAKVEDAEALQSGATVLTVDEKVTTEKPPEFNAEKFKTDLKVKITDQIPQDEASVRKIINDPQKSKVTEIVGSTNDEMKKSQQAVVSDAQTISDKTAASTEMKSEIFHQDPKELKPENVGRVPSIGKPERAAPKPVTDEELQMQKEHDADSLDKEMADNDLSENQLAESDEPRFLDTLSVKQQAQKELCQVPGNLRETETIQLQQHTAHAGKTINENLGAMHFQRKNGLDAVDKKKEDTKTEEEKILEAYYTDIKGIYASTAEDVNCKLYCLEKNVSDTFQKAVDAGFEVFKTHITDRLEYYYDWHIVRRDYEKEDKFTRWGNSIVDSDIKEVQDKMNDLAADDPRRSQLQLEIKALEGKKKKLIINQIFDEEKDLFVSSLDKSIDAIAIMVDNGLAAAKTSIRTGKEKIDTAYGKLSEENKEKATETTKDFTEKFGDLERKVHDKEDDLVDTLSKQYVDSVAKLKVTFDDVKAEASLSWWQRAWRKIKDIALTIYNLGKLLYNVFIKAVSVIGDILAHPIRFIGNLIDGIGAGFRRFKDNLAANLEAVIFDLIMGTVPPGLTLPKEWNAAGIFDFVLNFFGLTKENIRQKAVDKFGEPFVVGLEKGFDLFIIFKEKGFAGLWEHVKEKIGDLKNQIIEEVKTFFKESILQAAIEFLLSVLTPVSGFIKACKSIINIVMFFLSNLEKIAKLIDSILDAMIDIAAGKIDLVATKVENALKDVMVVGIKFLAALVGINLDKIQTKITRIINAIKSPINRAIDWLFDKALAFAEKTGLIKLYQKGKEKLKGAAAAVAGWLGFKTKFKLGNNEEHELYFDKDAEDANVMVASNQPMHLKDIIQSKKWQGANLSDGDITTLKAQAKKINENRKEMTKERGEIIKGCFNAIVAVLEKVGKQAIPETALAEKIPIGSGTAMMGKEILVKPLSLKPGNLSGSQPTVGSTLGDELKAKYLNYFVEGHLLNHNLHGPGYERWNLTPITKRANRTMESKAERVAKTELLGEGKVLSYHVTVNYKNPNAKKIEKKMASDIHMKIQEMEFNSKTKNWILSKQAPLVDEPIPNDTSTVPNFDNT